MSLGHLLYALNSHNNGWAYLEEPPVRAFGLDLYFFR